jgi:hypothetical protein
MNNKEVAARFGCTVEQVRALHRRNAADTLADAVKAERVGRIRGYTAAQLYAQAARSASLAKA